MKSAGFTCLLFFTLFYRHAVWAADYYISTLGNDANAGTHVSQAWRSIEKVQAFSINPGFKAGDRILFEGGNTFTTAQGLYINLHQTRGLPENPILISSYGTGTAVIKANGAHAIRLVAQEGTAAGLGFEIKRLKIEGNGVPMPGPSSAVGILVWNYSNNPLNYLLIEDVEVSGFAGDGISVGRELGRGRFTNITIRRVIAQNNTGFNGIRPHSGSGIVIGGATSALIEHCVAYKNGAKNDNTAAGPVGIWLWDCLNSTIQFCESFNNETTIADGGGFDLDGGCQNCIIQYCYSHNNAGAGFLLAQFSGANRYGAFKNNTIRYNISQNDGRKGNYSGIMFWGAGAADMVENNDVYNNTIFMGGTPVNGTPSAVRFLGTNVNGQKIRNNIFITDNNFPIINAPAMDTARALFQNNVYWHQNGQPIRIIWGNTYQSLAAWKSAVTGQETWLGQNEIGFETDPGLEFAGGGITLGNTTLLHTLSAYTLTRNSEIIDKGLDLTQSPFGIDVGQRDFYGNSLPKGDGFDIGAHETMMIFPIIQVSEEIMNFGSLYTGDISPAKTLQISANHLTSPLTIHMPEGFKISEFPGGIWRTQLKFNPVETVVNKTIFIRFEALESQLYEANMVIQSEGAETQLVKLSGIGIDRPELEIQPKALDFGELFINSNSVPQKYRLSGRWLQNAVTIIVPDGFSVATSINGTYRNNLTVNPSGGQINRDIFVRFRPIEAKSYHGFLEHRTQDHEPVKLDLNGKGLPIPQILVSANTVDFGVVNIPDFSTPAILHISGDHLIGNLQIQMPDYFTVSLNAEPEYKSLLDISATNGKIDTNLFIRFQPMDNLTYKGLMLISSEAAEMVNIELTGSGEFERNLYLSSDLLNFDTVLIDDPNMELEYIVHTRYIQENVSISAPDGFRLAFTSDGPYASEIIYLPDEEIFDQSIFVIFEPDQPGEYSGDLVHRVSGMPDKMLSVYGFLKTETVTSLTFPWEMNRLKIFPNPASSFLIIEINHPSPKIFKLKLFATSGKLLRQHNSLSSINHIDLLGIPKGLCILELSTHEHSIRFKCAIE
jgi:hypothetical protein